MWYFFDGGMTSSPMAIDAKGHAVVSGYPLVNVYIAMEKHVFMGKLTSSMVIFKS